MYASFLVSSCRVGKSGDTNEKTSLLSHLAIGGESSISKQALPSLNRLYALVTPFISYSSSQPLINPHQFEANEFRNQPEKF